DPVVLPRMDSCVATPAHHQRLSLSTHHQSLPSLGRTLSRLGKVGELANVVDLNVVLCLANLAAPGQESLDQLGPLPGVAVPKGIVSQIDAEKRLLLPLKRDATELGHQGLLPLA